MDSEPCPHQASAVPLGYLPSPSAGPLSFGVPHISLRTMRVSFFCRALGPSRFILEPQGQSHWSKDPGSHFRRLEAKDIQDPVPTRVLPGTHPTPPKAAAICIGLEGHRLNFIPSGLSRTGPLGSTPLGGPFIIVVRGCFYAVLGEGGGEGLSWECMI